MALCCLLLTSVPAVAQSTLVDRIVAVVDGHVITLDEWQQRERFEALIQAGDPTKVRPSEVALNRLIDNALVEKNIASINFTPVTKAEVDQQLSAVRKQLNGATDQAWRSLLASYGLGEDEVKEQLLKQLNTLRFIDARFRPGVRITPEQIAAYYRDTFVPKLEKEAPGTHPPALADVTEQISRILIEQLMDQRFATWLQNLRTQARVQRIGAPTQASDSVKSSPPQ